ncbi:MAG: MATE family efflux transporter, partial [Eubacteriales bacterium]
IGDSKTPLVTVTIACIANVILDLALVAGLNLGAIGAAIATVTAQAISVLLSIFFISKKTLPFTFSVKSISLDWSYAGRMLQLGVPVALQSGLVCVSFLVVTSIINRFGVVASAAVGIVSKITNIVMVVPSAFMQSLSAFTAQNYGAGKLNRGNTGLKYGMLLSMAVGLVMAYLAWFQGTFFIRFFTDDPETTVAAISYLQSYAIDTLFVTVLFSMTGYFNGCGKTSFVMWQSVLGAFCIRIPLAFLFSNLPNTTLFIIGLGTPASTLLQIVACAIYFKHCQKTIQVKLLAKV